MITHRTEAILAAGLMLAALASPASAAETPRTNGALTASTAPTAPPGKSVFVPAESSSEGRNPFSPNSTHEASPPRRTAMINGRTFEPGEEAEVKVRDGSKVLIPRFYDDATH